MNQQFDAALQNLSLEAQDMRKRAEALEMHVGELRGLLLRERRRERDPDYAERVAAHDMLQEVGAGAKPRRIEDKVRGVWYPEGLS